MTSTLRALAAAALALIAVGCGSRADLKASSVSSITLEGADFKIADAAISSNCLTLIFAVDGYTPPPDAHPQYGFPPAKSMTIGTSAPDIVLDPMPLGGGGGGGGNDEDGRVWMRQEMHYSLATPVAQDTQVPLEISVVLNDDFGVSDPLEYRVLVVAGPGGGLCPRPESGQ
jgi:hypothetical protein